MTKQGPDTEAKKAGSVKAVVFDVGRVIVQWDLRCLIEKVVHDPAERDWVLAHVVTPAWHFQHDAGRRIEEMVAERAALFPAHTDAIQAYATRFNETIPGRVPGTAELIERLSDAGVPLFAITNFGAEFWDRFAPTEPVLGLFRDIVVSGREKLVKPDPAIFRRAAKRFGHAPQDMLFIDDNADNIAGAAAEGWQTHHFHDAEALETDLAARGLLPR